MDNKTNIEKNITEAISSRDMQNMNPNSFSALTLAYLGDCIYELYVRTYLTSCGNQKVNDLHRSATKYVCAKAQAEFYHRIKEMLTEEEDAAFRRGRNAKSHPPKNADVGDYKIATGVEALIGHLYTKGDTTRISMLMDKLFVL